MLGGCGDASHQRVCKLGRVVVFVGDGDGRRGSSCEAHLTPRHVLGNNLQLVFGGRQRLEDMKHRCDVKTPRC